MFLQRKRSNTFSFFNVFVFSMYFPYLEKYIDNIIDIKKCGEKVATLYGYGTVEELASVNVLKCITI